MISNKVIPFAFLFALVSLFPLSATSVSLQVIQQDAHHDEVRSPSFIIEGGIMDIFFESGIIVSNLPIVLARASGDENEAFKKGLATSREGALDYFVQVEIDYSDSSNYDSPDAKLLSSITNIRWKVTDVETAKKLGGRDIKITGLMRNQDTEIGIRNFAEDLAFEINKFLLKIR